MTATQQSTTVAVLGLGAMGSRIARRLLEGLGPQLRDLQELLPGTQPPPLIPEANDVPGQRGNVADLWTTDNTTTFHEAGAGADNRFIFHYLCVGNCTTDDDVAILPGHLVESVNTGCIHHRFDRRGTALLNIQ